MYVRIGSILVLLFFCLSFSNITYAKINYFEEEVKESSCLIYSEDPEDREDGKSCAITYLDYVNSENKSSFIYLSDRHSQFKNMIERFCSSGDRINIILPNHLDPDKIFNLKNADDGCLGFSKTGKYSWGEMPKAKTKTIEIAVCDQFLVMFGCDNIELLSYALAKQKMIKFFYVPTRYIMIPYGGGEQLALLTNYSVNFIKNENENENPIVSCIFAEFGMSPELLAEDIRECIGLSAQVFNIER